MEVYMSMHKPSAGGAEVGATVDLTRFARRRDRQIGRTGLQTEGLNTRDRCRLARVPSPEPGVHLAAVEEVT